VRANDTFLSIINQSLAKARFPNQNPIGSRFSVSVYGGYGDVLTSRSIEIIGVCGDTLYADLRGQPPPQFFIPYVQQTQIRRLTYQIRTGVRPEAIVPALRRVVHAADPELPLQARSTEGHSRPDGPANARCHGARSMATASPSALNS
jgi:hypothetical protein